MKQARSILAVLLCGVLLAALCGCAGTPDASGDGGSQAASDASGSGRAEVSQEFLDSLKGLDMKVTYPWTVEKRGDSVDADIMWDHVDQVNAKYGCNITLESGRATYSQVMVTSLLGKKPMGDVLMCQDTNFPDWYNAGIFCDLTEAAKTAGIDFSDEIFNQDVIQYTNVNGEQIGFYYGYDAPSSIFYNKRLLSEAGLEDPHALLKKGEWTFAKMEEYARLLKKTDANGNVEVWGLGAWGSSDFLAQCVSANGGSIVGVDENGKPKINLTDPATMEAMEYMYRMAVTNQTLDAVDPANWEAKMHDFIGGKYAMLLGTNSTLNFCYRLGMQDEYGVITFPVGPSNKDGKTDCMTNITFFFIPKLNEEKAAQYLFLMNALSTIDTRSAEEQFAQTYALRLTDEDSYNQYFERTHSCPRFELIYLSGCMWTEPGIGEISGALSSGTSTPGAITDKLSSMLQTTLNDKWGQMTITGKIPK